MTGPLFDALGDLIDLLAPPCCAHCRRDLERGRALCPACDARIPRLPADACLRCQERGRGTDALCAPCRSSDAPLAACVAAARFEGETARLVRRFKYAASAIAGLDARAEIVVAALVREAASRLGLPAPDAVVPVPIHRRRLRRRGLHVAGILASEASRALGVPCRPALLRRIRDTPSQTGLSPDARRRNVAGAFRAPTLAPGTRIWLVDDVVTTGATLGEAARVLRAAGAGEVAAVCAARTPRLEPPEANG